MSGPGLATWTIDTENLQKALAAGEKPLLLDVREPEEYAEVRIEGSVLIPLGELGDRATRELPQDRDIIVYCAHGVRSLQGLMALRTLGYLKLKSLTGGICEWEESGGPVVR